MNFDQQIKQIRQKEQITQEQFALKLNISRQAVSNWENNKNLTDIGMLILISELFDVSLDQLIKGGGEMSNMAEKVIKDGSETRRARYNMISAVIGGIFLLLGVVLLLVKHLSVEYVDTNGILHENFFLVPLSLLCLLVAIVLFASIGFKTFLTRLQ